METTASFISATGEGAYVCPCATCDGNSPITLPAWGWDCFSPAALKNFIRVPSITNRDQYCWRSVKPFMYTKAHTQGLAEKVEKRKANQNWQIACTQCTKELVHKTQNLSSVSNYLMSLKQFPSAVVPKCKGKDKKTKPSCLLKSQHSKQNHFNADWGFSLGLCSCTATARLIPKRMEQTACITSDEMQSHS